MAFDPRYHDRVVAIACADGHLLVIRRVHPRYGEFYSFPGGGARSDEDPETALKRELKEETGLDAVIGRAVFSGTIPQGNVQRYYLVTAPFVPVSLPRDAEERDSERTRIRGTYEPQWVAIDEIEKIPLQPDIVKQRIIHALRTDFPPTVVDLGPLYPTSMP